MPDCWVLIKGYAEPCEPETIIGFGFAPFAPGNLMRLAERGEHGQRKKPRTYPWEGAEADGELVLSGTRGRGDSSYWTVRRLQPIPNDA